MNHHMDRIQNILERIQGVYSGQQPKTVLDIDLMLDYTRVLYADLLEWKNTLPAATPEPAASPLPSKIAQTAAPQQQAAGETAPAAEQAAVDPGAAGIMPEPEEENHMETSAGNRPAAAHISEATSPEPDAGDTLSGPEDKQLETLIQEKAAISFEPPHPAESRPEFIKEILEEEKPEENAPVTEIPVKDAPADVPDYAKVFNYAHPPSPFPDIRRQIGINDKYLFLNELFNNNKTEYEETLDKLNKIGAYTEALGWIKSIAGKNKWYEEDETVKSFYGLLEKHFSSR